MFFARFIMGVAGFCEHSSPWRENPGFRDFPAQADFSKNFPPQWDHPMPPLNLPLLSDRQKIKLFHLLNVQNCEKLCKNVDKSQNFL